MSGRWDPERRRVALIAGFPGEEEKVPAEALLEIEEALLSFARAALSRRRRIVLAADRVIAPLVAQVAAEYALPPRTEAVDRQPPLVDVLFSQGRDPELAPALAALGCVELHASEREEEHTGRHRLGREEMRRFDLEMAVVIGDPPEVEEAAQASRELGVEPVFIGPTLFGAAREVGERFEDATARFQDEIWEPPEEGVEVEDRAPPRIPYPYVMQRLLGAEDDDDHFESEEARGEWH